MWKHVMLVFLLCSPALFPATSLHAGWLWNGVALCTEDNSQRFPRGVSDGAGGAIFAWIDSRSTAPYRGVYAQRIDGYGNALWAPNGVPFYACGFCLFYSPEICSDGVGGVIAVWSDNSGAAGLNLHAQRIDANGAARWGAGVTICAAPTDQRYYDITADGAGGAIVAWEDSSSGLTDIYVQKIDASGVIQWTPGGVVVCADPSEQHLPCLVSDGLGGAIIVWDDHRGGTSDIYGQRVDASGNASWAVNGKIICSDEAYDQLDQRIISDGVGGAIVVWRDFRNNANWRLYGQRVDWTGDFKWVSYDELMSVMWADMYWFDIAPDGSNGVIVAWCQGGQYDMDVFAQRVSVQGSRLWGPTGYVACNAADQQRFPAITASEGGGCIISWSDMRTGSTQDIYAQKLTSDAVPEWATNGVPVCDDADDQSWSCVASDGAGGALFAWEDYRPATSCDVYAQRIERCGNWGYPSPAITSVLDVPDDQGGRVRVTWQQSRLETPVHNRIAEYSVWRMLPATQLASLLARGAKGIDPTRMDGAAPGAVYVSTENGAAAGWELLEYVEADDSETYARMEATLFDSTAADPGLHRFMVMAHSSTEGRYAFWQSQPDSGYSVDNIAPSAPGQFSAEQSFDPIGLVLSWGPGTLEALDDQDFSHYALYRGPSADFVPDPGNRLYAGVLITYFDGDWRWNSGFYYKLSAVDIHGNESTYLVVTPDDVTGSGTPPAATYLEQNAPNPFNPGTTIRFGIREACDISLAIYDVSGRLVRIISNGPHRAGHFGERWDGRNDSGAAVASGVYFCRLRAGGVVETKKMVLAR